MFNAILKVSFSHHFIIPWFSQCFYSFQMLISRLNKMEDSVETAHNLIQSLVTGDREHENVQVANSEKQNFLNGGASHEGSSINVEDGEVSVCFESPDGDSGAEDDENNERGQLPCENGGETSTFEGGIIVSRNPLQGGGGDMHSIFGGENPTTPSPHMQRAQLSPGVELDGQSSNPGHHLISNLENELNTGGQKDEESHDLSLPPAQSRHPLSHDEVTPEEEPSSTVCMFTSNRTSIK